MSKALSLIIPQTDAVEIIFFPQETLLGGRNRGLDAWFSCISCNDKMNWLEDLKFLKCNSCGCDVSAAEAMALIKEYRRQLDQLMTMIVPPKVSFWKRLFRRK